MANRHHVRRFFEGLITASLWGGCLFIGVALAKKIVSVFQFAHSTSELLRLFFSISFYIYVPLVIVSAFLLWRYFNILQYKKNSRTTTRRELHPKTLWLFGLNRKSVTTLQNSKNQTLLFDKKSSLIRFKAKEESKNR